jgi:hypothetical protein
MIIQLSDLNLAGLRKRWRSVFRKAPPPHLPRHLLFSVLAYRLQVEARGDLDAATVQLLRAIGSGTGKVEAVREAYQMQRIALRPGTILMREWNGRPQRVTVTNDGFVWQGRSFDSLSAVAFAVTGTRWNGHRFFGLRDKRIQPITDDPA